MTCYANVTIKRGGRNDKPSAFRRFASHWVIWDDRRRYCRIEDVGDYYVMVDPDRRAKHYLQKSETSPERLHAHWVGFRD